MATRLKEKSFSDYSHQIHVIYVLCFIQSNKERLRYFEDN